MLTRQGSFKIFTFAGIGVYVHCMWILVAVYSVQYRTHEYSSMIWNVAEYLSLFLIVLIHEFGHQLACRSVGGQTHDIVLWFLGGVAYVTPPPRPGAELWSIAAGPLVNVVLVPVLSVLVSASSHLGWYNTNPDLYDFLHNVWWINLVLLIFNMLPIYPLDGGQILRALLWFPFGRANSLFIASIIGFVGVAALIVLAIWAQSVWMGLMTFFILTRCWGGLKQAQVLGRMAKLPRRDGFTCPSCSAKPPLGAYWRCSRCNNTFDIFQSQGICPACGMQYPTTQCLDCGKSSPLQLWSAPGGTVDVGP